MASATEQAIRRLEAALQSLEIAMQQRLSQAIAAEGLAEEVAMLTADRARLAESLDQAEARAQKLDNVNRDVSRRLGTATEAIRGALQADGEQA